MKSKLNLELLFVIYLISISIMGVTQNLVPNYSFEEYYNIPSYGNNINECKYWYTPRGLSPDYFHKDAVIPEYNYTSTIVSIPNNIFGYQIPIDGDAYIGISNIHISKYSFREMIAVRLFKKLTKDSSYVISFYTSLAEGSMYYHNYFGITLSNDSLAKLKTGCDYGKVLAKNSITVKVKSIGKDTVNWHLVQTTYKAKGGEQYLYLGLTKKNMNRIRYWITKYFRKTSWGDEPYAYYYIDDVSVIAARDESIK